MHHAERLIALGQRPHDHAEPEKVRELLKAHRFALHLAPDRIGTFVPPVDLGDDATFRELALELLLDLRDQILAALGKRGQALGDDSVSLGVELAERQVLELLA